MFDHSVLFTLKRWQAAESYSRPSQSFCVRGWLSEEFKNILLDDYIDFIDHWWFVYLDDLHIGQEIQGMVMFWSSTPKSAQRRYISYVFKLCCLCSGHMLVKLPAVTLGSFDKNAVGVDLSEVIQPL